MTTLQILSIDWNHLFNVLVLIISASGFIISYNKYMKRTVDKMDLDKLEKKMESEDTKLSNRLDKVEAHIDSDLKEIKQQNRDIMNYLLNNRK